MQELKTYLDTLNNQKEFAEISLAFLSASAVLREKNTLQKLLSILKDKKFNKRKIYEALLQTYLFAGFPSALISLSVYSEYFEIDKNYYESWDIQLFKKRGEKNCRKIYGAKFDKLINNVNAFSPDLSDWLITEGYGKVLGRKSLSLKEREICNIAVLSALKYDSQLYSHINGGYRLGLTIGEIEKIIGTLSKLNRDDCVKFGKRVLKSFINGKGNRMVE
jgi:4-carboxymuconolactone decarboxylase